MIRKPVQVFSVILFAGFGLSACGTLDKESAQPEMTQTEQEYEAIIQRSQDAFMAKDVEGAIADLDEDFRYFEIGEEGPKEAIRGKDNVREALTMMFATDRWLGAEVDRWGLMDNIMVQVEKDTYKTEDGGTITVPTLVVFEHRNGKRWREWRFRPEDK